MESFTFTLQAAHPDALLGEEIMVSMESERDELSDSDSIVFPIRVAEQADQESGLLRVSVHDEEALSRFSEEELEEAAREAISQLDVGGRDRVKQETGLSLSEWREMPWWPNGMEARLNAGYAGHDREIVLVLDGYDYREMIPEVVADVIQELLPEGWMVENRGTRLEAHPSGHFAGGYSETDLPLARQALRSAGFSLDE